MSIEYLGLSSINGPSDRPRGRPGRILRRDRGIRRGRIRTQNRTHRRDL